jgi:hypothetical protein
MALEVKTAKNSKLPKMSESCFEPVGKGGWPPISIWIREYVGNVVNMGIIKWTTSQRKWKSVQDLMRSGQLRERILQTNEAMCI